MCRGRVPSARLVVTSRGQVAFPGGGRDRTALHRPDHSKLVQVGAKIPDGVMAAGPPAQVRREIAGSPLEEMLSVQPCAYIELGRRHAAGIEPVSR